MYFTPQIFSFSSGKNKDQRVKTHDVYLQILSSLIRNTKLIVVEYTL